MPGAGDDDALDGAGGEVSAGVGATVADDDEAVGVFQVEYGQFVTGDLKVFAATYGTFGSCDEPGVVGIGQDDYFLSEADG